MKGIYLITVQALTYPIGTRASDLLLDEQDIGLPQVVLMEDRHQVVFGYEMVQHFSRGVLMSPLAIGVHSRDEAAIEHVREGSVAQIVAEPG